MPEMPYDYRTVTVDSVTKEADDALARADAQVDRTVASIDRPTFDDTLRPLELAGAEIGVGYGRSAFMAQVHPDAAVRDAGQAAEEKMTKWRVAIAFREDVVPGRGRLRRRRRRQQALTGERARLLEHWMRDFRRAGHELAPEQRAELEALRNRLVELQVGFARNINESPDWIEVDRDGLAGLPDSYVERLRPGEQPGTYRVSLDYPEINPFMERATNRAHREALFRKNFNQAAGVNRPLLTEALEIRRRIAALLGHPTWAHYAMEVKMAAEPDRVAAFYDQLVPPLEAAAREEIGDMARMHAEAGATDALQPWDWHFYDTRQSMEHHGVDQNEVTEYLPLDPVLDGMFALTGDVFGLDYERVPEANAWHPSVQLFRIKDRATRRADRPLLRGPVPARGQVHARRRLPAGHRPPRGGRHLRQAGERDRGELHAAERQPAQPADHGPHGEIETLFHEFGHILHMSLTQAEFTRFSGAETEWRLRRGAVPDHGALGLAAGGSWPDSPATTRPASPSRRRWWSSMAGIAIHQRRACAPPARSSSAPWTWPCTPRPMSPTWTPPSATAGASPSSPIPRTPSCWPASAT